MFQSKKKKNYVSESSSDSENMSVYSDTEHSEEEVILKQEANFDNELKVGEYVWLNF